MFDQFGIPAYLPVLLLGVYLVLIALGIWMLWAVIRSAVRRALRDHQLWLESRRRKQ